MPLRWTGSAGGYRNVRVTITFGFTEDTLRTGPGDVGRYPTMEMPPFFERDQDEIVFRDTTYLDFFNLYPNLWFEPTLNHLQSLDDVNVLDSVSDSEGWRVARWTEATHRAI